MPDGDGRLVNAAGFYLMGYSFANGTPSAVANGFGGLEPVLIVADRADGGAVDATASSPPTCRPTRPSLPPANLPSANAATATYSAKSSLVVYDNLGNEVLLDVYFTKTGANTWEVAVFNQANAAPGDLVPLQPPVRCSPPQTLTFDAHHRQAHRRRAPTTSTSRCRAASPFKLDLAKMTQLATGYTVLDAEVDGNAPSGIDKIEISADGTVYAQYENGSFRTLYRIPIATVQSPDQLNVAARQRLFAKQPIPATSAIGFANEGGMGSVVSGALENSNVDIAEELTNMIESQRSYTANSKVFQTGADLMDILVNLKR